MLPLITSRAGQIAKVCERFGVARLDVFGSAARATDFNLTTSDIDFAVEYLPGRFAAPGNRYLELARELEVLLGRPVDLVAVEAVRNRFFLTELNATRKSVYAAPILQTA